MEDRCQCSQSKSAEGIETQCTSELRSERLVKDFFDAATSRNLRSAFFFSAARNGARPLPSRGRSSPPLRRHSPK
jgi:hypothetical protein